MPKEHRTRVWSENRQVTIVTSQKKATRMAYCWECWGPGCVKDGRPTHGASLFRSKRDAEVADHKES